MLEITIILFVVSLFSLITSKALSLLLTVILYIVGHSIKLIQSSFFVESNEKLKTILDIYYLFLPDFSLLNIKEYLFYPQMMAEIDFISVFSYGILYSLFLCVLNMIVFKAKELE